MKIILLIFILSFVSEMSHAQRADSCNYELSGVILDIDTKQPLPFVTLSVNGTQQFALTDIDGNFAVKGLCETSNTLIISCLGYCDTTCLLYTSPSPRD